MAEDNGAYDLARRAYEEAQEASSRASDAAAEARQAYQLAEQANEKASEALQRIAALEEQVERLERAVEHLINMLQDEIRALAAETRQVAQAVETQGHEIQARVRETTESVDQGFSSMSRQEAENRLLDTRTALAGLAVRLMEAQHALAGEYEMAKRRGDSQKERFRKLAIETGRALNLDIERLGAQILRIQGRDFVPLTLRVEQMEKLTDGMPSAFDVARQAGEASMEQRRAAIDRYVQQLDVDLTSLASERMALLGKVSDFSHGVSLAPGSYALRVYAADGHNGSECFLGAIVECGQDQVRFGNVTDGLGRLQGPVKSALDRTLPDLARPLTTGERQRVIAYLDQMHGSGLLTEQELGILHHHVSEGALEVCAPER